jgi:hypothetical protein
VTMMKKYINPIMALLVVIIFFISVPAAYAGDLHVNDYSFIRKLLLQPDPDFEPFIGSELCDAFIWLIDNDNTPQRDRIVDHAISFFRYTEDERAVPYLIQYLDEYPMDCLYNLGYFSTPESCRALLDYVNDDDLFNRRFAIEALGKLDFTVSDDMWDLRDDVIKALNKRSMVEKEDFILKILNDSVIAIQSQVIE